MSIADYSFEERLERAATLPSSWYTDPEILALEKQRVFGCGWQLVGRAEQVARPGDYFIASIADEPIIIARGEDEKLRAFSNVCRHRAGPVATGSGTRRVFQWLFIRHNRCVTAELVMLDPISREWIILQFAGNRYFQIGQNSQLCEQ